MIDDLGYARSRHFDVFGYQALPTSSLFPDPALGFRQS